ncbi:MAG TPA: XrtA-associated tyrosine autokinase [Burkholderiaceae bacterium]|nr:XrtA-associated tyrosine autokinase [Burkholderiaceae bacterium]
MKQGRTIIEHAIEMHGQAHAPAPETARAADTNQIAHRPSRAVTLDLDALAAAGFLVQPRDRTSTAEAFRHIKLPVLSNLRAAPSGTRHPNLVMVTSSLPGEGKTFCTINLALSIAMEIDHRVLLVDADVIRAGTSVRLGVDKKPGLIDLLEDPRLDLASVMVKTNLSKLTLLPAGSKTWRSTELLASTAMDGLLEELASRYSDRVIVFDTSPLLLTAEAKVMASRMGQVLVVVESETTPGSAIVETFSLLRQCPTVMSVLNKGRRFAPNYGYYYG